MNRQEPAQHYLITGAAGFIGFHLSKRLLDDGCRVYGVDILNDYYDPSLKQARLARTAAHAGFTDVRMDLEDRQGIADLFAKHQPDAVVFGGPGRHRIRWSGNEGGHVRYPCWSTVKHAGDRRGRLGLAHQVQQEHAVARPAGGRDAGRRLVRQVEELTVEAAGGDLFLGRRLEGAGGGDPLRDAVHALPQADGLDREEAGRGGADAAEMVCASITGTRPWKAIHWRRAGVGG